MVMRPDQFRCHALLGQLLSLVGTTSLVCERKTKDCCGASIVSCDTSVVVNNSNTFKKSLFSS